VVLGGLLQDDLVQATSEKLPGLGDIPLLGNLFKSENPQPQEDQLAQRISAAYAQGESSAATVVSEVESDADLSRMMQELPAVEDLLEAADDAPIIRMLNALLTQAARDGASDIHIEPYERHSAACAFGWTARCARWCSPTARCTPR
jgi:type II secretory ATPase GspE/PulE/Tfp pilus assembly ATPase PilB-like protein